jgi:cell division transport system permease protein
VSAWLRQHRQAFAVALRRIGILNTVVIGVALALPAGGYALIDSLRGVASRLAPEPQIAVFLPGDAKRADADALGRTLRAEPRIASVRFVPREQALKDMRSLEGVDELVAAIGRNPLPDAFVVTARTTPIDSLAADLAKLPGVSRVQADAVWARRLAALAGAVELALAILAVLLGVGLVAVTFNTIRLQILTQRAEIEVSKLIGATDAFIRRPFYYAGLLQGLAGGLLALAIVAVGLGLLDRKVASLAASYGSDFRFGFLALPDAVVVILFAGLLGWLGAQLSVGRHLREIEPT